MPLVVRKADLAIDRGDTFFLKSLYLLSPAGIGDFPLAVDDPMPGNTRIRIKSRQGISNHSWGAPIHYLRNLTVGSNPTLGDFFDNSIYFFIF